ADAFEDLQAFLAAFRDQRVHLHGVAGPKRRQVLAAVGSFDGFDGRNAVAHDTIQERKSGAELRAHRVWRSARACSTQSPSCDGGREASAIASPVASPSVLLFSCTGGAMAS